MRTLLSAFSCHGSRRDADRSVRDTYPNWREHIHLPEPPGSRAFAAVRHNTRQHMKDFISTKNPSREDWLQIYLLCLQDSLWAIPGLNFHQSFFAKYDCFIPSGLSFPPGGRKTLRLGRSDGKSVKVLRDSAALTSSDISNT